MVKRTTSILAMVGVFFAAANCAMAQSVGVDLPPPVHSAIDANGINLVDGSINFSNAQVSVGVPGQGGLARVFFGGRASQVTWSRDNLTGTINSSGSTYTVSVGSRSLTYSLSGTVFTPSQGDGSTLTKTNSTTYALTMRDGTQGVFSTAWAGSAAGVTANVARITSLTLPTGEVNTYTYSIHTVNIFGTGVPIVRVDAVTNNFGYEIKYIYKSSGGTTFDEILLSQIIALNNAVDYCAPAATSCPGLSVNWPSVTFNSTNGYILTDNLGRQTTYPSIDPSSTSSQTATLVLPSGQTITLVTDTSARVTSFSNGVSTWHYAYVDSGTTRTTTVTDPLGHTRVVVSDTSTLLVSSDKDGLNHTTSFTYGPLGRLIKVTRPELDFTSYTYDGRGNITQTVVTGKDLVTTITTSANFDATCTVQVKCNRPNWTRDGRGNQTDYTYSTTTGQLISVVRPAGANGLRPEADYTYTSLYAWFKNSAGTIVQADTPISLPTKISQCATAQTCPGTANAVQTVTTYGSSGVANNLLPTQVTQGSGDGVLAASIFATYDAVGNQLTQTDAVGSVTRFRYDVARQLVGTVSPDPDGGGVLRNRAVRLTYQCDATIKSGCDGLVTLTEQGTVASQSDADWAGFSALGQAAVTYDSVDRKTLEKVSNGSTYIRVAQYSYDASNRPTCAVMRMNPTAIGSLPASACTLGTTGSAGPDRISAYSFDNANRLLKITNGSGTTVASDDVTYTYGANNEIATQADGKGHLSTIVRDAFNRTYQVQFPDPANGGVSSTTDYEQYSYDNNSNVTQNRRRDGTLVNTGYDALNLPTSGYNGATFGFDNLGRLAAASVSGQSLSFGYNALSQPISESNSLGSVLRQYYLNGQRKQLTYPDGYAVTYGYNATGELTSITDSSSVTLMSIGYDDLGRAVAITRAQGASESRSYGSDLRLSALSLAFGDSSKNVTFNYAYNLAGQPVSVTDTNAQYRWSTSRVAAAYTSDGQNRYGIVGANNLTYDGRANTTSTGLASFGYDGLNRMTSAPSTTMNYDAIGRLSQVAGSTTTQFLSDGQQIIAEYNGAGALQRRFVPGPGLDQPLIWFEGTATDSSSARWLLADAFGSIVGVGNSGGVSNTTIGINTYDEFGLGAVGNIGRFQYKGMAYIPETGLYHARARTYSQYLGRFLQPDPSGYGDGMNMYSFIRNSPFNGSDPSGLCSAAPSCPGDPDPSPPIPTLPDVHVDCCTPPSPPPPDDPITFPEVPYSPPGDPSVSFPRYSAADSAQSQKPPKSFVQSACSFASGDSPDNDVAQIGSAVGLYDDTGRAFGAASRSLVALGNNVSRVAGPLGTALSAGQFAYQLNNGQYSDAAFTAVDFAFALALSTTGPLGIAADIGFNAAGGSKASAMGAAGLICKFGGGGG